MFSCEPNLVDIIILKNLQSNIFLDISNKLWPPDTYYGTVVVKNEIEFQQKFPSAGRRKNSRAIGGGSRTVRKWSSSWKTSRRWRVSSWHKER